MDISKIDKNLAAKNIADKPNVEWYNIKEAPFKIYGLYNPQTAQPENGTLFNSLEKECPKCHAKVTGKFCSECGEKLE